MEESKTVGLGPSTRVISRAIVWGEQKGVMPTKGRFKRTLQLFKILKNLALGERVRHSQFPQEGKRIIKKLKDT